MKKHSVLIACIVILMGGVILARVTLGWSRQANKPAREKILSKDFNEASEALEENVRRKKSGLVRMSLQHPSLIIKRRAAEALRKLKDRASVPSLIEALELNQAVYVGGTETELLQDELNRAIVSALVEVTGIDVQLGPTLSDRKISEVITKSKKWWSMNKHRITQ